MEPQRGSCMQQTSAERVLWTQEEYLAFLALAETRQGGTRLNFKGEKSCIAVVTLTRAQSVRHLSNGQQWLCLLCVVYQVMVLWVREASFLFASCLSSLWICPAILYRCDVGLFGGPHPTPQGSHERRSRNHQYIRRFGSGEGTTQL